MNDDFYNDKMNYILLSTKARTHSLTKKEKKELSRLKDEGLNSSDKPISEYIQILVAKHYLSEKDEIINGLNAKVYTITEQGLKGLEHNHFLSESQRLKRSNKREMIQNTSAVITICVALISLIFSTRSCMKETEIDKISDRVDKLENIINK